jgi:antitoxin component YwqK of YwqJK toxin-antitoxin module
MLFLGCSTFKVPPNSIVKDETSKDGYRIKWCELATSPAAKDKGYKPWIELICEDSGHILHGPLHRWYPDGKKQEEMNYQNHKHHGRYANWWENGNKWNEGTYENEEENGHWIQYYSNGQKCREGDFKNGKRIGVWIQWHENGQKNAQGRCTNDVPDGEWSFYHPNGKLFSKGMFMSGQKTGRWTRWYANGNKMEEGDYGKDTPGSLSFWDEETLRTWLAGNIRNWHAKTTPIDISNLGKVGKWSRWNENGVAQKSMDFSD